ncbi:MAG: DUF167 domain-containing protein [Candidatus Peribacteraceae bacterium]
MIDHLVKALHVRGELRLTVRVRPSAKRTCIKRLGEDGVLRVDVAAQPEGNRANTELVRYLAEAFGIPRTNIDFISGGTSRTKTVRLRMV